MKTSLLLLSAVSVTFTASAALRFGEICPRPTSLDPNGRESGWVELVNDGEETENLADYELARFNRGKAAKAGAAKTNLKSREVAPGTSTRVYTSEVYDNCKDLGGKGTVAVYANDVMVYPVKVNPKKFPYLQLYKGADETVKELVDEAIVPVDLADDCRYDARTREIVSGSGESEKRVAVGPNVGPVYGVKDVPSDLDPLPLAEEGVDYAVTFAVNPMLSKLAAEGDAIDTVTLLYTAADGAVKETPMVKGEKNKTQGQLWAATVPAADLPAPGRLLRLAARIATADGKSFRSPSFHNPDDGYEWYGTLVKSDALVDKKLPTWHLFVEGNSLQQMDVDADKQDLTKVPYQARCGIYDSSTGRYYDNVRIDLRGNTSGGYRKKSHGFKFAKCNPYVGTNPLDGSKVEIRKTSLTAEYGDPTYIRQGLSFYVFRLGGAHTPFFYPVRLNLNGEFYQLAFHTARFSDELIEDQYGLDPLGYGYKNSGCLTPGLKNWVTCEKKTPDDGDETSAAAMKPLKDWTTSFGNDMQANQDDQPKVTKEVVKTFDLPAWINYLAQARITEECDDSWANLSTYGDVNGTGTWMPLGYDMNQTWGYIYRSQWDNNYRDGLLTAEDRHKSHPFFGGRRVLCYYTNGTRSHPNSENWAFEAVWQSTKFRRLYLRRLRTLMDRQLMPPGTPRSETPIWSFVAKYHELIREAAALDAKKWRYDADWYRNTTSPYGRALTLDEGYEDLWNAYIEPRRTHLYVTHSAKYATMPIGYGEGLAAGIPETQLPLSELVPNLVFDADAESGLLTIRNNNAEAVDLSGWTLSGTVNWTLPAGTVADANDVVLVVADRKAYVAAHEAELTDQVIVGNAPFDAAATDLKVVPAALVGNQATAEVPMPDQVWFRGEVPLYGTWSDGTRGVVSVATEGYDDGPVFTPDVRAEDGAVVYVDAAFRTEKAVVEAELPDDSAFADARSVIVLGKTADGNAAFYLLTGKTWTRLSAEGFQPYEGESYALRLELDYRYRRVTVSVRHNGGWLTLVNDQGEACQKMKGGRSQMTLEGVSLAGSGKLTALVGSLAEGRTYVPRTFSIRIR